MLGDHRRIARVVVAGCLCIGILFGQLPGNGVAQTYRERGAYLVNAVAVCGNCHTPHDAANAPIAGMECHTPRNGPQLDLSRIGVGGRELPDFTNPEARTVSRNITPDPETGIGKWSDADVKRAILIGQRPDGTRLSRTMPSTDYFEM